MKRHRILYPLFLAACLWSQSATHVLAAQDPSDVFVQALLASQSGEKLAADGKNREALAKFRFAAGLLDQIKADSPKWQPLVREYRSKKTAEHIANLEAANARDQTLVPPVQATLPADNSLIPGVPATRQPTPVPTPVPVAIPDDIPLDNKTGPAGSAEAEEMRRQINEARLEIRRLRTANAELTQKYELTSSNLRDALKKVDQSRVAVAELRSQLAQAEDRLHTASIAKKKDNIAIDTLTKSVAVLQRQLAERSADANLVEEESNDLSKNLVLANQRTFDAEQVRDAAIKEKQDATQARDTALADLQKMTLDKAAADQAIADNAALTAKLDTAEKKIAQLSQRPDSADVEALKAQITDIQQQLTVAQGQTKEYAANIEELKAQLDTSNKALAEARKNSGNSEETLQLKSENDLLRGIVLRTIKDQVKRNQAREIVSEELARIEGKSQALLEQVDVLGTATLQLSDDERKLFKEPELAALDATDPGLSVEMTQTGSNNIRPKLPPGTKPTPTPANNAAATPVPTPNLTVPDKYASLVTRAKTFFEQGKMEDAERAYNEILTDDPNNLYALSNLGVVNYKTGKLAQSEKILIKAAAIAPKDFFVNCTLGIVYYRQGKFEKAIESLTQAITIDPSSATAHNYLGIAASQKGWFEAAVKELDKAITLNPKYADAFFNRSVIYSTCEPPQLDKARESYEKAIELGAERDPSLEKLFGK